MKGLIIKDFKLLMMQKSFFVTLTIVAIFFGITTNILSVVNNDLFDVCFKYY